MRSVTEQLEGRVRGYDLIRSFAVMTVFLAHIIDGQVTNPVLLNAARSVSPGLTMSLLGFISGALLSSRNTEPGPFLVKRLTRIYVPLLLCLTLVLVLHALVGRRVLCQHTLLHFLGLSGFFDLFLVKNHSSVGSGLWFITTIIAMYLLLPLLITLFRHKNGLLHIAALVLACIGLSFVMYATLSTWNVVISFCLGVYLSVNDRLDPLLGWGIAFPSLFSAGVIVVCALSTAGVLPYTIRAILFPLYPIAFVPLFFYVAERLPRCITWAAGVFAGLSYEFYILHFYFINDGWRDFFSESVSPLIQIAVAFAIIFTLAYVVSAIASRVRQAAIGYFLGCQ
jgi:peptidoglycan/LPS O-acetylase OafA/YrhL